MTSIHDKLHEECGIFGVYSPVNAPLASTVYYGLFALQHRGQESCGIVTCDRGVFSAYKDLGTVDEVFTPEHLSQLEDGNMAVGHVRYSTAGGKGIINAQPIVVDHIKGHLALAHNGNLVNAAKLREQLELNGAIFHMTSDTEVISYIIIKERLTAPSIEEAVNRAMNVLSGAYSLVIMSPRKLIAARDEHGFRPLCYGRTKDGMYIVASESCALDAVGATFIRDIDPGEIVIFDDNGIRTMRSHCEKSRPSMCVFEYIYFARPDSVIDGHSVHCARLKAGEILAKTHPAAADLVIGVPDSGIDAAIGYARASGIPYGIGLIKNRYIGRTFISPGQKSREDKVRIKLNPVSEAVRGKKIILIDDSIVRGTTSRRIVELLREAGAVEIHMRISSPPFISPCYYGTDVDSCDNLIACKHSNDEIARLIGVDSLDYLSPDCLPQLFDSEKSCGFCDACFTRNYPTRIPDQKAECKYARKIGSPD